MILFIRVFCYKPVFTVRYANGVGLWDAIVERDLRGWKWKISSSHSLQGSAVYNPWKLRNDLKLGNVLLYEEKLLQNVGKLGIGLRVKGKLYALIGVFLTKFSVVCIVGLVVWSHLLKFW